MSTVISKTEFSYIIEHQDELSGLFRIGEGGGVRKLYCVQKLSILQQNALEMMEPPAEKHKTHSPTSKVDEQEQQQKKRRNARSGSALLFVRSRKKTNTILF